MNFIKPVLLILILYSNIAFAGLYTVKGIDTDGNNVVGEMVTQGTNLADGDGYIYIKTILKMMCIFLPHL